MQRIKLILPSKRTYLELDGKNLKEITIQKKQIQNWMVKSERRLPSKTTNLELDGKIYKEITIQKNKSRIGW